MTNKEQIWHERLAVLKDVVFSMLPGIVILAIFLGVVIATGRINAQWQEQVRARRGNVNNLAVDQLKDFAVIQAGTNELETLPKGIDSTRFTADNEAFVKFVDKYMNWDSWDDMYAKYEAAKEQIGDYPLFWNEAFFVIGYDSSQGSHEVSHDVFFGREDAEIPVIRGRGEGAQTMAMWQRASVQDVHAIEILPNGSYLYMAIVPLHRYGEDWGRPVSKGMCAAIWYSCDMDNVIKPERVRWLTAFEN